MCHLLNSINELNELTMAPSNTELTEGIRKCGVVKEKLTRFGSFFDTF